MMECSLYCEAPNKAFLDQMCNTWNVSSACQPDVGSVEMTTYTNMSKVLFEHNCLYLPVDTIFVDDQQIQHPYCANSAAPTVNCSVVCNSRTIMNYITKTVESLEVPYYATIQFQTLFMLMIGAWACQSVIISLADSICFHLLGNKKSQFFYHSLIKC